MDSTLFKLKNVPHPGETVLDYIEDLGWTQSQLARRAGLTAKTISEICNGKTAISPNTSIAFEKVFGRPAHFWMGLQSEFEESLARRQENERSLSWTDWVKKFPIKEMKKAGWINADSSASTPAQLLRFLGVSSPDSWSSVWADAGVSYRQTRKFKTSVEAISAWVRATEIAASEIPYQMADYNEHRFMLAVEDFRALTRLGTDTIVQPLQALCASVGVAVVFVPELSHMGVSGSARWISERRPIIALTLRYKTDDQLWFTFFHEMGHILLHKKKKGFILDNAETSMHDTVIDPEMQKMEEEANRFAAETLIPPRELTSFIAGGVFTNESIHDFAEDIGIGPGIVVGRLQKEGILKHYEGNTLKQNLGFADEEHNLTGDHDDR